jgi:hypothetical protein
MRKMNRVLTAALLGVATLALLRFGRAFATAFIES